PPHRSSKTSSTTTEHERRIAPLVRRFVGRAGYVPRCASQSPLTPLTHVGRREVEYPSVFTRMRGRRHAAVSRGSGRWYNERPMATTFLPLVRSSAVHVRAIAVIALMNVSCSGDTTETS